MTKSNKLFQRGLIWSAAGCLALGSASLNAAGIGPGFDLFSTPGFDFTVDLGGGPVDIPMIGDPKGPGNTDTIVHRKQGIGEFDFPQTIDIELVGLSLKSVDPIPALGGDHLYLWINREVDSGTGRLAFDGLLETMHPNADPSIGLMEIDSGPNNFKIGTDIPEPPWLVYAEAFKGDPNGSGMSLTVHSVDQSGTGTWSHDAPMNYPSDPELPSGDFYVLSTVHTGPHPSVPSVPIPAALPLFGSAIGVMGFIAARRRKKGSSE